MNLNLGTAVIVLLAVVGIVAAVLAFLRTPSDQRWRLTTRARQREQALRDERVRRGELVPIAAQPWRFWRRHAVLLLAVAPALGLAVARAMKVDLGCTRLAGWNLGAVLIAWLIWVAPAVVTAVCLAMGHMGWRGWTSACFPPADAVLPARAWGDRTWRGRLRAGLAMVMPLLALGIVLASIQLHGALLRGRSLAQMSAVLDQACTRR